MIESLSQSSCSLQVSTEKQCLFVHFQLNDKFYVCLFNFVAKQPSNKVLKTSQVATEIICVGGAGWCLSTSPIL